jgi:hypothetical protein
MALPPLVAGSDSDLAGVIRFTVSRLPQNGVRVSCAARVALAPLTRRVSQALRVMRLACRWEP